MSKYLGPVLLLISLACIANEQKLKVLSVEYPPFTSSEIEGHGLCFDYLADYFEQLNLSPELDIDFVPPARAEALINRGEYCMSFYPPRINRDLYKFVPLGPDEGPVKLGLIRLAQLEAFAWKSLEELKGRSVAILRANVESQNVRDMRNAGVEVLFVESVRQGLKMVKEKRVDYVFGDLAALEYLSKSIGYDSSDFQISDTSLVEATIGFFYRLSCEDQIYNNQ